MPIIGFALLFLLVAVVYAAVGFGGGSTYNALLVLGETDYRVIPSIALSCNIVVVSGGTYHFYKEGVLKLRELAPFVILSVPLAWFGGSLEVEESTFIGLLGIALLVTGVQLIWTSIRTVNIAGKSKYHSRLFAVLLGGVIGLVSGVAGIGGGIFLAPFLYLGAWGEPRKIAAIASGFILVNSASGLAGQLMKNSGSELSGAWFGSWPLFLAVFVGGQIGSRLGSKLLPQQWMKGLTGLLILYVAIRLIFRWIQLS